MGNFVNKKLEKVRQRRQNTEKRGKLVKIERKNSWGKFKNIARGTMDPEIDSVTWIKQHGSTCISCKFGHQMTSLALVANLATRWRHLH